MSEESQLEKMIRMAKEESRAIKKSWDAGSGEADKAVRWKRPSPARPVMSRRAPATDDQVRWAWSLDMPLWQAAEKLNMSRGTLTDRAKRLGLPMRGKPKGAMRVDN